MSALTVPRARPRRTRAANEPMTLSEVIAHVPASDKFPVLGGVIYCTARGCAKYQHAHYSTPMGVPVARSATFSIGGTVVNR